MPWDNLKDHHPGFRSILIIFKKCDLVARFPAHRSRDTGFDSRGYEIFGDVVGLERDPLRLTRTTEELRV
jgi:hypothetical protein